MTEREYDQKPGIRRSDLFQAAKSPIHFRFALDHETDKTPALVFGSAIHKLLLEPESFGDEYTVMPEGIDRRTVAGRAAFEMFTEANMGKEYISADDYKKMLAMIEALKANGLAWELLRGEGCRHEVPIFWTDETTGEELKCKPDCITSFRGMPYLIDYKTTESCADGQFERSMKKYGYYLQAGMYTEGATHEFFEEFGFAFVAQEKTEPYASRVYILGPDAILKGYDEYRALLGIVHECKTNDEWPGYEPTEITEGEES